MSKCQHNRRITFCKECKQLGIGGKGICEHDKYRYRCVECNGEGICEHKKEKINVENVGNLFANMENINIGASNVVDLAYVNIKKSKDSVSNAVEVLCVNMKLKNHTV
jgi:hypothetical protein